MPVEEFVGPEVQWFALSPLLVLLGGGLFLLVVGALVPRWPRGWYAVASCTTAGAAAVLAAIHWVQIDRDGPITLVGGALAFDVFAMLATITICVAVVLVSLLTDDELRQEDRDGPEVYALYLMAAIGGIVMASANDLIVLFLGLEALSLALYVLAASNRSRPTSQEAGLKYFVLGGFSSAFLLYGIALVYGGTGSTNISEIVGSFQATVTTGREDALLLAGIALLLVGLGFKVAAVPFHVWVPDVYQGSPSPVTAFMAAVGKAAAFGAVLRVFVIALPFHRDDWRPVIWVLALLSLVVGPAMAVVQTNVKRMLAFSSIGHVGFMLVGVEAAAHRAGEADPGSGMQAVLLYTLFYAVLTVGTLGTVAVISGATDGDTSIERFAGLGARRPVLAFGFTVLLFAQAGVPFTTGFLAKFGVIRAAVEQGSTVIAVVAMAAAVIAAAVYLRIMKAVWLSGDEGADEVAIRVPVGAGLAIALATTFTLVVGILPGWLLDVTESVVQYAR